MIPVIVALMLAPTGGSIGENRGILRDPQQGPTPITDKDLRPSRPPNCRNEAEVRRAVEQVRNGELGDCWVKDARAFNRHGT